MVKGLIRSHPSDQRVENMEVGQKAYLDAYDVILTRDKIYIDRFAPILLEEEYDEDQDQDVVPISRIGPNLTEDDFELDFTDYDEIIETQCGATDIKLEKYKEMYIIFTKFDLEEDDPEMKEEDEVEKSADKELYSKLTVSELEEKLNVILNSKEQDFETAVILRDLIEEKKSKKERKHPGTGRK